MTEQTSGAKPDQPGGNPEIERESGAPVELPVGIRIAAAWSWRLILIGLAIAALLWLIMQVSILVIPLILAILLTALLQPVVTFFERLNWPRWLGVLIALITFIVSVSVLVWLIVSQLRSGFDDVLLRSTSAWYNFLHQIEGGLFGFSPAQINGFIDQIVHTIENNQSQIWSGALAITTTAGHMVTGALLTLFSLIFLLIDGKRIWFWVLGFLPARAHAPVDTAGRAGWVSVGQYVRVQIFVAFVDAVFIGLGAAILGVPLAIPIAILVFLGSFIPFLGAITTGALAVLIALVYNGPVNALIMLAVVIAVNQLEGHILQPLVMGNAVRLHPLAVVLAVSAGALLAGIPGALFAVPLAAAGSAMVNAINERRWDPDDDPVKDFWKNTKRYKIVKYRARNVARHNRKKADQ